MRQAQAPKRSVHLRRLGEGLGHRFFASGSPAIFERALHGVPESSQEEALGEKTAADAGSGNRAKSNVRQRLRRNNLQMHM